MRSIRQDAATYAFLTEQNEDTGNTFGHDLFAPGNRPTDALVQRYFKWVLKLSPASQEGVFSIENKAGKTVAALIKAGDNLTAQASYAVLSFHQSEDEEASIGPPPLMATAPLLTERKSFGDMKVGVAKIRRNNFFENPDKKTTQPEDNSAFQVSSRPLLSDQVLPPIQKPVAQQEINKDNVGEPYETNSLG